MPRQEAQLQPAEDVIHDGLGKADLFVASPAGGLEASVGELLAQYLERDAVLQRERNRGGKGVHEPGDSGTLFGHLDEDLTRLSIRVEAYGDIALVSRDGKFVGEGGALLRQAMAHGTGRSLGRLRLFA